jgi:solute carrier family 30 (zinc transporter), member 2
MSEGREIDTQKLLSNNDDFLAQRKLVAEQREKLLKKSILMKSFSDIKDNRGNCQNEQSEMMKM